MMGNTFEISIVLASLVAFALSNSTNSGTITPIVKLLIDSDAGADDMVALIMISEAERLDNGPKIIGITCVNGNTNVNQVALNVLKTLKVAKRLDIPVYKGTDSPLLLPVESDNYFGADGFGEFYYPDPPSIDLIKQKHAVTAMIDLVKEHPGEITLLALGPLTNVALAIRMHPTFLDELQQLIIFGGSTEGQGIASPGIEFNFKTDPIANYIVFHSSTSKPAILIPWETHLKASPTTLFAVELIKSPNRKTWLLNSAEVSHLTPDDVYWETGDAVAAAVALTSGSIVTKSRYYYSEAIFDGSKTAGMIIVDFKNITGNPANIGLVQEINAEVFKQLLTKYFTSEDSDAGNPSPHVSPSNLVE